MNAHGTRAGGTRAAEAWPGLDDQVRRHHEADGAAAQWEVLRKVAVAVDARVPSVVALPMEADGCVDVLIVPDEDVGAVEVEAFDDGGRLIARGTAHDRTRTVVICSPLAWTGSLTIRPHAGQGLVAVVVSRGRSETMKALLVLPEVAWAAAREPAPAALARRESELRRLGYAGALGSRSAELHVGKSHPLAPGPVDARGCMRFDVVAGAPTAIVSATAWDGAGYALASAEGPSSATLFTCGVAKPRLDLEAGARPGPVVIVWRPEPWFDPAFAAHPAAASRMLTRLSAGTPPSFPGSSAGAHVSAMQLDGAHEASWSEVLEPSACVHIGVGAAGEGAGLTARVVDLATGEELDRSHGADTAHLYACAPETSTRTLAVTLVATAGKLDVVVGERTVR